MLFSGWTICGHVRSDICPLRLQGHLVDAVQHPPCVRAVKLQLASLRHVGVNLQTDDVMQSSSWNHFSTEPVIVGNNGDCTGPGHNGWFSSPDGAETWLVYHGTSVAPREKGRSSRAMRLNFNSSGWPVPPPFSWMRSNGPPFNEPSLRVGAVESIWSFTNLPNTNMFY